MDILGEFFLGQTHCSFMTLDYLQQAYNSVGPLPKFGTKIVEGTWNDRCS
jgi:hypothetical protein